MIELRAMEKMAEAHRRELTEYAQGRKAAERASRSNFVTPVQRAGAGADAATQRSTTGLPVTGGRAVRRPVGQHLGELLIRAGIRLGGTTSGTTISAS
jgi:hypothetical protein